MVEMENVLVDLVEKFLPHLLMCAIVKPIHSEVWYTVLLQPKGIRLQPWFKGFNSQPVHQSLLRELFQRPLLNQVPQELCVCQTYCLPQPSDCFYTLWRQLGRQIQLLSAVTACIEMDTTTSCQSRSMVKIDYTKGYLKDPCHWLYWCVRFQL